MKGWVIDRDYLNRGADDAFNRVGHGQVREQVVAAEAELVFARTISVDTGIKASDIEEPVRFRLLDDDGSVYYGGAISKSWLYGPEYLAFAPLQFGETDAGCTELQYREDDEWKVL